MTLVEDNQNVTDKAALVYNACVEIRLRDHEHWIRLDQLSFQTVGRNQLINQTTKSSKPIIAAYKNLIKVSMKFMKPHLRDDELEKLSNDLLAFEGKLANIPIRALLQREFSLANITLTDDETIETIALDYYRKLNEFLRCADPDTLYNYAGLRRMLGWASVGSKEYRNASFEFQKVKYGLRKQKPRWEVCVQSVNDDMPDSVGYLYVQQKFSEEAKQEVPKLSLGDPYGKMMYAVSLNKWIQEMKKLRRPYDRDAEWLEGAAVVNAFYNPSANEMDNYFSYGSSMNFGAIGMVVGHEMTHGFDDTAKLINESLNTSVDPCTDFYSYACGGWLSKHQIPKTKPTLSRFSVLRDELRETLRDILGNMTLVEDNQNATDKAALVYNACVAVPDLEDRHDVVLNIMNASGLGTRCTTTPGLRRMLGWADVGSKEFRNASFELRKARGGVREERPRWEICVDAVNGGMPDSVGLLYVQQKFSHEAKKEVPKLPLKEPYGKMMYAVSLNNWILEMKKLRKAYDTDAESLNFGAIGMVVGHEMTHGFDDTGSQFDAEGALKQWWSNKTRKEFMNRTKCFEYQYGNITDKHTNMTLNGKNTVGENIADNGGLRLSFEAYRNLLEVEYGSVDTRLVGMENVTGEQLFFISNGMAWCSLARPEYIKLLVQYDPHSPAQYRINVPMSNLEAFSETFNCPANSTMNRKDRCTFLRATTSDGPRLEATASPGQRCHAAAPLPCALFIRETIRTTTRLRLFGESPSLAKQSQEPPAPAKPNANKPAQERESSEPCTPSQAASEKTDASTASSSSWGLTTYTAQKVLIPRFPPRPPPLWHQTSGSPLPSPSATATTAPAPCAADVTGSNTAAARAVREGFVQPCTSSRPPSSQQHDQAFPGSCPNTRGHTIIFRPVGKKSHFLAVSRDAIAGFLSGFPATQRVRVNHQRNLVAVDTRPASDPSTLLQVAAICEVKVKSKQLSNNKSVGLVFGVDQRIDAETLFGKHHVTSPSDIVRATSAPFAGGTGTPRPPARLTIAFCATVATTPRSRAQRTIPVASTATETTLQMTRAALLGSFSTKPPSSSAGVNNNTLGGAVVDKCRSFRDALTGGRAANTATSTPSPMSTPAPLADPKYAVLAALAAAIRAVLHFTPDDSPACVFCSAVLAAHEAIAALD
ncbi:hypothetical protein HPB52_007436 [Rhipicephalus sanguineus]|uniref:Uncharacterized protein n=1 Tax=Rhipicephalus sanguineus TaxID=34632 RepID=A0A9D4PDI0_RHISA|nr:hypothetical protein HPB52_007436 [Rhipicephalus sanguineus]